MKHKGLLIFGVLLIPLLLFARDAAPQLSLGETDVRDDLPEEVKDGSKLEDGKATMIDLNGEKWLSLTKWDHGAEMSILFDDNNYSYVVYENEAAKGVEFDLVIDSKKDKNEFVFTTLNHNLDFFYQPSLQEEFGSASCNATNCWDTHGMIIRHRPQDVVGSLAVYHSSNSQNDLKAGKAFHIYRPKAFDAKGDWVWANLSFSEGKGTIYDYLSITVPAGWLENAEYPVRVDPVIGYTTVGGTSATVESYLLSSNYTMPEDGEVVNISVYISYSGEGSPLAAAAIYHANDSLLAYTNTTGQTSGWNEFSGFSADTNLSSGTSYRFAVWGNSHPDTSVTLYDVVVNAGTYRTKTGQFVWPDPMGAHFLYDARHSIYMAYTTAAAEDSCTYGGSGDWVVQLSDNCSVVTTDLSGSALIVRGAAGSFEVADGGGVTTKEFHIEVTDFDGDVAVRRNGVFVEP